MLDYMWSLVWDPTAPVPNGWPHGWYGVLMLFCIPGGLGIPSGVLLGHRDGLGVVLMTVLYFLSDVVLACVFEPLLQTLAILSRSIPRLDRACRAVLGVVMRIMPAGSVAGPTGVMLATLGAGLPFGRALAAAAGYGLVTGWLLSIAADMIYYAVGMVSTLWFDGLFGDQRLAVLAGLAVMLVVPLVIRRVQRPAV